MILLDTTPLVALCDPRDALHQRALRDLDHLGRRPLFLCEPVLTETCFLLEHGVQRTRLNRLVAALAIRAMRIDPDVPLWERVFAWLDKYADQEPDWADGYLAVLTGVEKRAKVWTYDAEFRTTWRREDGSKIPLAIR